MNRSGALKEFVLAWPLMLSVVAAMNGPELHLVRIPPAERSWNKQIAAIRAGDEAYLVVDTAIVDDVTLAELADLTGLKAIELGRSEITERGLEKISDLPKLERVTLRGRPVNNAMLAILCRMPAMRYLNLPDSAISNEGLAALDDSPELLQLRVGGAKIGDAGMTHISKLHHLRFLHLIDIPLTDRGLKVLATMSQLESLYIDGAAVTDVGIESLLRTLPGLHFHSNQQHHDNDPKRGTHSH